MSSFQCPRCQMHCCTCSGCHAKTASDGTNGCTRCIPTYEQGLQQPRQVLPTASLPVNRPRNVFTERYGVPQITYK